MCFGLVVKHAESEKVEYKRQTCAFMQVKHMLCEYLSITKGETDMQRCFWLFSELLYNLTADVEKRQRSQPSRAYFTQNGSQISQVSQQLRLDINKEECQRYTAYVKVKSDTLHHPAGCFSCRPALIRLMTSIARSP